MSYSYSATLTIDYTKVPNTDQTDFPVLVNLTDYRLRTTDNGGQVEDVNGYDIGFFSDEALTTPLYWDMERYNGATGQVVAHVKIPTVSHTVNTVFYIAWGDAGISTFQSTASSVWSNGYGGVWHLADGITLGGVDSIASGHNMTAGAGATALMTGHIGGAGTFSGATTAYMSTSAFTLSAVPNVMSISAWLKTTSANRISWFSTTTNNTNGNWSIEYNNGTLSVITPGLFVFQATVNLQDGLWHHVVFTRNGIGNTGQFYVDGAPVTTTNPSASTFVDSGEAKQIGERGTGVQNWDGSIDEVRYSTSVRLADWVATEYNNQSSPSTFLSISDAAPQALWYLTKTVLTAAVLYSLSETAVIASDAATGWTVDSKADPNFSPYKPATVQAATTFVTTEPTDFSKLGYRSPIILSGEFADGTWVVAGSVKNDATYYAQTGYVRFRLWAGTAADGTGATQITPGWQSSAEITFTAGGQTKTFEIAWAPGDVVSMGVGSYLFLEIEWSAKTSGGNAAAAVYWIHNNGFAVLSAPAYATAAVLSQIPIETLGYNADVNVRASQVSVEALAANNNVNVRVSQVVVEILSTSSSGYINTMVIG